MSRARRSSLFRGSELPRLLILAAIALAGWPMVVLFAQGRKPDEPPPAPPVAASGLTPVVADEGVEFQAVVDKAPMQARENAAYAALIARSRATPPAELQAQARRDVLFAHLWERPERYRGVPVHIEGTALRVLTYEVNPAMAPSGRIFEAWTYADDNRQFPYVLAFDEAPPGLVVGPDLFLKVAFDGYFLKLLAYPAGGKLRAAPLLVGRLQLKASPPPPAAPMVGVREWSRRYGFLVLFALLFGYIGLRAYFQFRRALAPTRRTLALPERDLRPREIDPVDLSRWLESLPDDDPDDPAPPDSPAASRPGDHP